MSTTRGQSSFHIGDRVSIGFGRRKLTGVIVEDRGAIGAQGRRLFQVSIPMDPFEPMMVELPEEEMEAAAAGNGAALPLNKQQIIAYLANGGLISILRSNLAGGKNQPQAWLCHDQLGNVTHTFLAERGVIGGQLVPLGAVHDDKIFTPKKDSVRSFVESLGLKPHDAEKVVADVGTAP